MRRGAVNVHNFGRKAGVRGRVSPTTFYGVPARPSLKYRPFSKRFHRPGLFPSPKALPCAKSPDTIESTPGSGRGCLP
jgi:hypothetical protein